MLREKGTIIQILIFSSELIINLKKLFSFSFYLLCSDSQRFPKMRATFEDLTKIHRPMCKLEQYLVNEKWDPNSKSNGSELYQLKFLWYKKKKKQNWTKVFEKDFSNKCLPLIT